MLIRWLLKAVVMEEITSEHLWRPKDVGNPGRGTSQNPREQSDSVGIKTKRSKKVEAERCPLGLVTGRLRVRAALWKWGGPRLSRLRGD